MKNIIENLPKELLDLPQETVKNISLVALALGLSVLFFEPFRKGALAVVGAVQVYSMINKLEKGNKLL